MVGENLAGSRENLYHQQVSPDLLTDSRGGVKVMLKSIIDASKWTDLEIMGEVGAQVLFYVPWLRFLRLWHTIENATWQMCRSLTALIINIELQNWLSRNNGSDASSRLGWISADSLHCTRQRRNGAGRARSGLHNSQPPCLTYNR